MDITLEKVERLREKADVSYTQAKEALDYSGGDLLDALIYLEEQGTIPRPEEAYYSTRGEAPVTFDEENAQKDEDQNSDQKERKPFLARAKYWLMENELEIWYREKPVTAMPVLVMLLLLVLAAWAVIPLAVLGILMGFRVRFAGPDSDRDEPDPTEQSGGDTASDLGRRVMDELRRQHEQNDPRDGHTDDTEGQGV